MKKFTLLIVIGVIFAVLAGCGETENTEVSTTSTTNTETPEVSKSIETTEEVPSESATILATGTCGDNITWTWDDSETLTLSGEGDMETFLDKSGNGDYPWTGFHEAIVTLVVGDGITSLGDRSFCLCYDLENIILPDSIKYLGEDCFRACTSLTAIVIPDSVTSMGKGAYSGCTGAKSVIIGNGITDIPDEAFENYLGGYSTKLKEVTFGENVRTISESAFQNCHNIEVLTFTGDVIESEIYGFTTQDVTLRYPKDNPTWVESGFFTEWRGKVEAY